MSKILINGKAIDESSKNFVEKKHGCWDFGGCTAIVTRKGTHLHEETLEDFLDSQKITKIGIINAVDLWSSKNKEEEDFFIKNKRNQKRGVEI